jgi:hypothetical protein
MRFQKKYNWGGYCTRLLSLAFLLFLFSASPVFAGFGITPPYVRNDRLTPGSVFEQQIILVRSDPVEDLQATITVNTPGIESWISIDRGKEFILPKGQLQVPIVITVRVPKDAAYESHTGAIRIRTASLVTPTGAGVSIALGAQVDVALTVVDKVYDFSVRKIRLSDLEEGVRKWGLFFPGKIRFYITAENTGNTPFGPTRVQFDIYDSDRETFLERIENTNKLERIDPFATKEILAELPTRLPVGLYSATYTIYKNEEIAQQNEVTLSINPLGTVAGYEGYGFEGLSLADKAKFVAAIGIPLLFILALILISFYRLRALRRARQRSAW